MPDSSGFIQSISFRVNSACVLWVSDCAFVDFFPKAGEFFLDGFDVRNVFYLFGAAGGGVEGSLEKTRITFDERVAWGRGECGARIEVVGMICCITESITMRFGG